MPDQFYEHSELVKEAAGSKRQPEFAPEVVVEEPVVEGALANPAVVKLIARQAEIVQIIADEITNHPENVA